MILKKGKAILSALALHNDELSVVFVDDKEITDINNEFRGKNNPTNVIAFSMREGEFAELDTPVLGDVVISVETAQREAGDAGITFDERITQLLVHGVLHLAGYDHETSEEDAKEMEMKSLEIIRMIEENQALSFF